MLIRFLANTYIRLSPYTIADKQLGYVKQGTVLEVEDEAIEGILHEGSNKWYKDASREWYYWGGEIEEISEGARVLILEDLVLLAEETIGPDDRDIEPESPERIPTKFDQQAELETAGAKDNIQSEPELLEAADEKLADHPKIPDYVLKENWADAEVDTGINEDNSIEQSEDNDTADAELNWSILQLRVNELFWDKEIKGKGIKVAILDTGIKVDHPLFSHLNLQELDGDGYFLKLRNFIRQPDTGETDDPSKIKEIYDIEDESGQGTCNAGIIAALGAENKERIGLAPEIELYIGKIKAANAGKISFDTLQRAVEWTMEVGINILFIGAAFKKSDFEKEVQEDLIDLGEEIQQNGTILIAPVGDTERTVPVGYYPAALPTALSVGAFDQDGKRYGKTAHSFSLDVLAPGVALRTTNLRDGIEEGYTGTTAAAAYTAGLMALLLGYLRENCIPCCNPEKMISLLKESAGIDGESCLKVRSHVNGFGNVDPAKFIEIGKEKTTACA